MCGLPWKTCGCPQWTERHLLARAGDIVDRNPELAVGERRRQVRVLAQELRRQPHCEEHDFRFNHGEAQCEECRFEAPVFTMVCRACRLRVCRRCMNNRL